MSTRLLAVITEGQEAAALRSMAALVAVARAEQATVRLAYFRPIPAARVDRCDRVVVPVDLEMERVAEAAASALRTAARAFDDVVVEPVVRFGRPQREVGVEAEAFAADLVVLVTSRGAGLLARVRAWALRRQLARRAGVRLLILTTPQPPRRGFALEPLPAWRGDVARERR
jgi:hypothetical protein